MADLPWEKEWREKFGSEEKDEADNEDDDEEERRRKKPKVEVPSPLPTTSVPAGLPVVPKKRRHDRPRKVILPVSPDKKKTEPNWKHNLKHHSTSWPHLGCSPSSITPSVRQHLCQNIARRSDSQCQHIPVIDSDLPSSHVGSRFHLYSMAMSRQDSESIQL